MQPILILILTVSIILLLIFFLFFKIQKERNNYKAMYDKIIEQDNSLVQKNNDLIKLNKKNELELEKKQIIYKNTIDNLRNESALFPSVIRAIDIIEQVKDEFMSDFYKFKKRPAKKCAEDLRISNKKVRDSQKALNLAINRVNLYESIAPWIIESCDVTLDELLDGLKDEIALKDAHSNEIDPVSLYISKSDWANLDIDVRNQLALDRYSNPKRKKSLWQVGRDYERFIGYEFEKRGYTVNYHGALKGREDLGIDLICTMNDEVVIIQCKRLSQIKKIQVRENTIAQTYGASVFYKMNNNLKKAIPVIVTSYELSSKAREFAKYLNVIVMENYIMKPYPMIKCNISKTTGEKIYHLPMDQQYDKINMMNNATAFYTLTVKEAVSKGFRRAYHWRKEN